MLLNTDPDMAWLSSIKYWFVNVLWPSNSVLTIKRASQMSKPIRKLVGRLCGRWIERLARCTESQCTRGSKPSKIQTCDRNSAAPTYKGAAETSRRRKHKRRRTDHRSKQQAKCQASSQHDGAPRDHERKLP
ncbi:MAG: hypothetical protein ACKER6_01200 [Candidatus Hodgkinia cicadicola]